MCESDSRLRGEGRGEGAFPQFRTRGEAPSPGMSAKDALIPTSPRKRGEVKPLGQLHRDLLQTPLPRLVFIKDIAAVFRAEIQYMTPQWNFPLDHHS